MDIKERAKLFAINAHMGQVRKSEPEKPMIIHPIGVGELLEEYGYDDNIVAAGFLHDVVEDTKYTNEDIEREFGSDIANLVMCASEPDKSLSWEERKRHTIESTRNLPLRKKLVICADKVNNLEDIYLKFARNGVRDFSSFNRGEEQQRWYYTNIYESLIAGGYENEPLFVRLKNILDKLFNEKEDLFLKETIFSSDQDYYSSLKKLHAMKLELQKLKSLCQLPKPFIIEFSGTPRTGKTTVINNLYDFFKKGGFDVELIEEFTTSKYYKEKFLKKIAQTNLSRGETNIAIVEAVYEQLQEASGSKKEIVLIDRSINDRQIWNYQRYLSKDIEEATYLALRDKYSNLSKEMIDFLVCTYVDSLVSVKRDYTSSLALEQRRYINEKNISLYNDSLMGVKNLLENSVDNMCFLDTSTISPRDTAVEVASNILPAMRKKYIKAFENKYNLVKKN